MVLALFVSPAPMALANTALPPAPIIVESAMMMLNTGITRDTAATLAVSPSCAIKNRSAIL